MVCEHVTSDHVVYLKSQHSSRLPVQPRRYCMQCGLMRERGARKIEHFSNLLQDINQEIEGRKHLGIHPFTQVEMRLIIKSLEGSEVFNDPYGSNYEMQISQFKQSISKYRTIPGYAQKDSQTSGLMSF